MIRLENLSKEYGQKLILDSVTLHFPETERIALVGANGAGKTTLLKIIIGEEEASAGQVLIPGRCRIGYLPQEPNPDPLPNILEECIAGAERIIELKNLLTQYLELMTNDPSEENIENYSDVEERFRSADGYAVEAFAKSILRGLGFHEKLLSSSPLDLSGGWRMRLELAKLFINEPDFLILDEPTNHLDLPSLIWVENYLTSFKGTLLYVSHDRELLNRLSTITIEVSAGRLKQYKGGYDSFVVQKEIIESQELAARRQIEKKAAHMQVFVDRFGAKATKAKQAQSRVKMIDKLKSKAATIDAPESRQAMVMNIAEPSKSGRDVLKIRHGVVGYGSLKLQSNIEFLLERGMKAAVIGANGIGKSTFLKTISSVIPKLGGEFSMGHQVKMAYFAQDQLDTLHPDMTVLENILAVGPEIGERDARSMLGNFLFSGDDVFKKAGILSGGEKSRVGLAATLLKRANFLILDEPTNHLDMESVEILAEALKHYKGSILFVSHSRSFINGVASHVIAMTPEGRSLVVEGGLDDYQRMAKLTDFPDVLKIDADVGELAHADDAEDSPAPVAKPTLEASDKEIKDAQKNKRKLAKEVETLGQTIAKYEKQIIGFETQLGAVDASDHQELTRVAAEIETARSELSVKEDRWIAAGEEVEAIDTFLRDHGRL